MNPFIGAFLGFVFLYEALNLNYFIALLTNEKRGVLSVIGDDGYPCVKIEIERMTGKLVNES